MFFASTLATVALAITATVSAAPAAKKPFHIEIGGLPESVTNVTTYLTYATNFFGELSLQPTDNKTKAILFNIESDDTLKSTTGQALSLIPLSYNTSTAGAINYTSYTGNEGTYVTGAHHKVLNSSPDFGSWLFCESQYGANVQYATPDFNTTLPTNWFPCFEVKFHARH